jgi:exodeoxyribonuclease VII large subunit
MNEAPGILVDAPAAVEDAPAASVYTVSEVTAYLRSLLHNDPLLEGLYVRGEISNATYAASGHVYFTLKDEAASLECVLFRDDATRVPFRIEDGLDAVVRGSVDVYARRGRYQLVVVAVKPYGLGELYLAFEQRKAKLAAEGLFDADRKRPLPPFPARIGVATSAKGAALRDILRVLVRRYPLGTVVLAPCRVQGDGAAATIVGALSRLNAAGVDAIIVARGGGSLEDLWPFNEEAVARAVAASRVPVVSGVGHETDWTLVDLAADLRAPTPSAAAERVAPDVGEVARRLRECRRILAEGMTGRLRTARGNVETSRDLLVPRVLRRRVRDLAQRLDDDMRRLTHEMGRALARRREEARQGRARLDAVNPLAILRRGYAVVVRQSTGGVVDRVAAVDRGENITIKVQDGAIDAVVTDRRTQG